MARDIAQEIINAVKNKEPDYKVTSLMQEREDKIKNESLSGKVPATDTIVSYAKSLISSVGGNSTGTTTTTTTTPPAATTNGDGVINLAPDPLFNPSDYTVGGNSTYGTVGSNYYTATSTSNTSTVNKLLGYVIVGLVGLALLDKFVNSSGSK